MQPSLLQDLMLLSRTIQAVLENETIARLGRNGLTRSRLSILRLLHRQGRQSVNQISSFIGQTKSSASQNVTWMVKAGLAIRAVEPTDRRWSRISLSEDGFRLVVRAEEVQIEMLRKATARLSGIDLDRLSPVLRAIAAALVDQSDILDEACLQCCSFDSAACVHVDGKTGCVYLRDSGNPDEGREDLRGSNRLIRHHRGNDRV